MKKYKAYSLGEQFEGRVKRLSIHIQDAGIKDDKNENEVIQSATIFGTLQIFKEDNKKKVDNINFSLPLNDNEDLKNHLVAMITQAISMNNKKNKK